jgi:23S rRNA (uridine2552-2'-O)-methyltransferase
MTTGKTDKPKTKTKVNKKNSRTSSSARWLAEHFNDPYVKQAQQEGYRSRAVYKLLEIHTRDRLFKPGMTVIDLGAAPGGWSQVAIKLTKPKGRVIAMDILPMEPLPGVEMIQGDFADDAVLAELMGQLAGIQPDLVLCDIAPNMSGDRSIDMPRAMYLAELALDFALKVLPAEGGFLIKLFQGEGFEAVLGEIKRNFKLVTIRKPKASRGRSREVYVLARNLK